MTNDEFLRIARVVADPTRFEILTRIAAAAEYACADLTCAMEVKPATISHHLRELTEAGLILGRKQGKFMHLRLNRKRWAAYLRELERRVPVAKS